MLESALQKHSSSPSETSLALISFFRHEYPLGGAVEARFLRFFPILCDRVFGPVLILSSNGSSSSNADSQKKSYSNDDLVAVQHAWLNLKSQWRSPSPSSPSPSSNTGSSTSNSSHTNSSTRSRSSGETTNPRSFASSTGALYSKPYAGAKASQPFKIESDPVVRLLSPSSISSQNLKQQPLNPQHNQNSIYNTYFLHILESTELSRQLRNIRLPFPFVELPRNIQESFMRQLQQNQNMNQSQQQQQQQLQLQLQLPQKNSQSSADMLWLKLHYPPREQKELMRILYQYVQSIQYQALMGTEMSNNTNSRRRSPQSSPTFHLSMNPLTGSPSQHHFAFEQITTTNTKTPPPNTASSSSSLTDAKVLLDAWEYFMILFFRHAACTSKVKAVLQQNGKLKDGKSNTMYGYNNRPSQPHGERVYFYLFKTYCDYYIQHIFGSKNQQQQQQMSSPMDQELEYIMIHEKKSELWIRLVTEFFLNLDHVYPTTQQAIDQFSPTFQADMDVTGLEYSYELASLLPIPSTFNHLFGLQSSYPGSSSSSLLKRQSYSAPTKHVQKSLRILVDRIIRDPAIATYCYRGGRRSLLSSSSSSSSLEWPLQSAQTLLQPHFYNYLRTVLRYGPVHVRNSSFYTALDLWLIWLEPWNVIKRKKSKASSIENAKDLLTNVSGRVIRNTGERKTQYHTTYEKPKLTTASKYTFAWESYIAANLHLYIIPLSIFLRRAREFDFSKEGFKNAVSYVQKVLRVFSPNVVKTLEKLMNHQISENESRSNIEMFSLVQKHENILGQYRPPRPSVQDRNKNAWSLQMLQQDMHALLEEILLQHRKTVSEQDFIERAGTRIQGFFFNEGLKAEERLINTLVEKAKAIVHFPVDYEVFPTGKVQSDVTLRNATPQTFDSTFSSEQEQSGCITEVGRSRLLDGSKVFNPMDICFVGDPMYARVKEYEVEMLVKLTIFISDKLNKYFELVKPSTRHLHGDEDVDLDNLLKEQDEVKDLKFRINLRFLADTRNWLFIVILTSALRWIF